MRALPAPCALCLAMLTSSCAAPPPRTDYVVVAPPAALLTDCPVAGWAGGDWLAVVDLAEARKQALLDCNADKAAIRDLVRRAQALHAPEED